MAPGDVEPPPLATRAPCRFDIRVRPHHRAAEAAAAGRPGDAATLLREVLALQENALGPAHPDLATTLNNLALMLEQVGDAAEAGRCYRRAYEVARDALGPDDPATEVSRANLAAFIDSRGDDAFAEERAGEPGDGASEADAGAVAAPETSPVDAAPALVVATDEEATGFEAPVAAVSAPAEAAARESLPTTDGSDAVAIEQAHAAARSSGRSGGGEARPAWPRPVLALPLGALLLTGWCLFAPADDRAGAREDVPPTPAAVASDASVAASRQTAGRRLRRAIATEGTATDSPAPLPDTLPTPPVRTRSTPPAIPGARDGGDRHRDVAEARLCLSLSRAGNPWRCEAAGDTVRAELSTTTPRAVGTRRRHPPSVVARRPSGVGTRGPHPRQPDLRVPDLQSADAHAPRQLDRRARRRGRHRPRRADLLGALSPVADHSIGATA